jgi:site-specific DNA recombinase
MRAATYAQLSDAGLSIPDQQKTARKYAEDRGWQVVAEFKDKHRSAFRKVEREEFEALLEAASDGKIDVIIARHQDRLLRHRRDLQPTSRDLCSTQHWNPPLRQRRVSPSVNVARRLHGNDEYRDRLAGVGNKIRAREGAVERNTRAGKRTGGGSKPFGYKIIRHHQGEGARRRWRIVGEELEPAEAKLIKDAATRVLRGESLRSIAMEWNKGGIKTVGASSTKPKDERTDQDRDARVWHGSMIRRVLVSPRIAGLREHPGEVITKDGEPVKAAWPEIITRETHHRLVGLLKDPSRRPVNYGRPRVHPLAGLLYCGSCGSRLVSYLQPRQGRGYGCRKDENPDCDARVRIAAEPMEAYIEGHVIDQWRNPRARKIGRKREDGKTASGVINWIEGYLCPTYSFSRGKRQLFVTCGWVPGIYGHL